MGNTSYVPKYKASNYEKTIPGRNSYKVDGKNVYWRDKKINADGESFKNLGSSYGKDKKYLYWSGEKLYISDTEKETFTLVQKNYAKSKNKVFYKGCVVEADLNSFKINNYGDIMDKKYLYKNGKKYKIQDISIKK